MLQIRTILVPTDCSACAERAYAPAAELAARYGAALRIVQVRESGQHPPADDVVRWEDVARDLRLPAGHEPPRGSVPIEDVTSLHASPSAALLDYARAHDVDLVVMGTHGRGGFARFVLGSVAEEVVRLAERPVLTVPCYAVPAGGPVLVPVDLSEGSREALRHAKVLAADGGVSLHVLHVVEWPTSPPPYLSMFRLPPLARVFERAQEALDAFVASADGPAVTTTASVRVGGSVIYPILRYAEEIGVGLVVVSTHGRTGLDRLVMGNVAQDVVRMLPCAVLTMRPGDRGLLGGRARAATEGNRAVPAVEPDAAR